MADFLRTAYSQLLKYGYNIYIPLQRSMFDEIVLLERGSFLRCIVKEVVISKTRGPTLDSKFLLYHKDTLLTDLAVDRIVAVLPDKHQVWLIPISSVGDLSTVRLQSRSDWLLGNIYNRDVSSVINNQNYVPRSVLLRTRCTGRFVMEGGLSKPIPIKISPKTNLKRICLFGTG